MRKVKSTYNFRGSLYLKYIENTNYGEVRVLTLDQVSFEI